LRDRLRVRICRDLHDIIRQPITRNRASQRHNLIGHPPLLSGTALELVIPHHLDPVPRLELREEGIAQLLGHLKLIFASGHL
jgi:hypothetical protein